jgi:hypothetical protein
MVVVDNARRLIGKNADIAVTSVLQTTAGKMIFGRLWEEANEQQGAPNGGEHKERVNGATRRTGQLRAPREVAQPARITDPSESTAD